ncbi:MAG TPA: LysR family transcriptional regulator, partial [Roseiarcus sp.]|nr:LysR family transcriptional regulator [Roseiarcus sp.]
MNSGLSWDEFRLVKSVAEARSLVGAAEILGVNHSTVFRRLAAVEAAVGARLFERARSGYEPTAAGEEMIALATTMAESVQE